MRWMLPALLLGACEPRVICDGREPVLRVGVGDVAWVGVDDGDVVEVYQGIQGRWHVRGSLEAEGIWPGNRSDLSDPHNPVVDFQLLRAGGGLLGGYSGVPRPFEGERDGPMYALGDFLFLEVEDGAGIAGLQVSMAAAVRDACGIEVSAEVSVSLALAAEETR